MFNQIPGTTEYHPGEISQSDKGFVPVSDALTPGHVEQEVKHTSVVVPVLPLQTQNDPIIVNQAPVAFNVAPVVSDQSPVATQPAVVLPAIFEDFMKAPGFKAKQTVFWRLTQQYIR